MAPSNIGWRVLANGAMIEVKTGEHTVGGDKREITNVQIVREGTVIRPPSTLTDGFIARYNANEDYARSLVERVEIGVDDEGEETLTPVGRQADLSEAVTDEEIRDKINELADVHDKLLKADTQIKEVIAERDEARSEAERLRGELEAAQASLQELNDELEKVSQPQALDYARLSSKALEAEVSERGLDVSGSGANGNVLKADNVKALTEDDTKA